MVVIDRHSKYYHFAPLKANYSCLKVPKTFMSLIAELHGFLNNIVFDRDNVFTSKFCQQLFKLSGTYLATSSSYQPQTDGRSKALNKCLELYLRCFIGNNQPKSWFHFLS